MSFIDSSTAFSIAQAAFASGADVNSTNIIDLAPHLPLNAPWISDEGAGKSGFLNVNVTTAFSGGTSMQVVLQTDTNTNFATVKTEPAMSSAIPVASLVAGAKICLPLPSALKRYLRVAYRNVGANVAGACSANISNQAETTPLNYNGNFIAG